MTNWSGFGDRSRDGGLDAIDVPGGGRLWLCGKHVVGPDPEAALSRADDAAMVVCLTERHEVEDRYPAYVRWLEEHDGGRALWFPVPDLHAPEPAALDPVLARVGHRLADGVVVHCGAGHGRAATVAVCVLASRGLDLAESLALVQSVRPLAGPQTDAQRDFLARHVSGRHQPQTNRPAREAP